MSSLPVGPPAAPATKPSRRMPSSTRTEGGLIEIERGIGVVAGLPCHEGTTAHILPALIEADSAADTAPDPSLFSRERQTTFLAALAATGQVRSASARAGVSHQTAYRARLSSPGFRRAWDAALLAARARAGGGLACRGLEASPLPASALDLNGRRH